MKTVAKYVGIAVAVIAVGWLVQFAWIWRTDYGRCLESHREPRHSDAWMEMRTVQCGKECTTLIPIMHPAQDWFETVCDRYEYPEGNGPSAGSARRAEYR